MWKYYLPATSFAGGNKFRDGGIYPAFHICLAGTVVTSKSFTQELVRVHIYVTVSLFPPKRRRLRLANDCCRDCDVNHVIEPLVDVACPIMTWRDVIYRSPLKAPPWPIFHLSTISPSAVQTSKKPCVAIPQVHSGNPHWFTLISNKVLVLLFFIVLYPSGWLYSSLVTLWCWSPEPFEFICNPDAQQLRC